ncbi:hypothetical protein AAFF_G00317380 [Aldrovandia affinis]|uniref:Uncharacterized protein n=1 Tax=Aldrovandia affinis TaxID=143900 RepID=A0AAD7R7G1_9TELE|nr:hypothetical protein AAFF_G00317380 [Aldrovandia affinis]
MAKDARALLSHHAWRWKRKTGIPFAAEPPLGALLSVMASGGAARLRGSRDRRSRSLGQIEKASTCPAPSVSGLKSSGLFTGLVNQPRTHIMLASTDKSPKATNDWPLLPSKMEGN